MKRISRLFSQHWLLIFAFVIFILLRIPSLFEPYWYGDEGIYQIIGRSLRAGRAVYTEIWDNKPPLIYVTYALFDGNQSYIRIINLVLGILSVITFYFISLKLFTNKNAVYSAVIIFSIFLGPPFIEGTIANAENFILFPILVGVYIIISKTSNNFIPLFVSGILFGISSLFKIVAVFDFAAIVIFLSCINRLRHLAPFIIGFILPWIITSLYFLLNKSFFPFLDTVFFSNIDYVGYKNTFLIPHGFLVGKLLFFLGGLVVVFLNRKILSRSRLFIWIWVLFSLFNVFFSGRPYIHYLLMLLPSYCLLIGMWLEMKKNYLIAYFIVVISVFIHLSFPLYWNILGYYHNFTSYITGKTSETEYQSFFDPNTVTTYKVAEYINQHSSPDELIYVWGNSPQIYTLSNKLPLGRFVVAYHITQNPEWLHETEEVIQKEKPKFIILLPDVLEKFPFIVDGYEKAILDAATIYTRI